MWNAKISQCVCVVCVSAHLHVCVLRDKGKTYIFVKEYNTSLFIKIIDILQDMGCDRKVGSVAIIVGDILAI